MAQVQLRRGLPRVPGGEPWPPAGTVEVAGAAPAELEAAPEAPSFTTSEVPLRRGLPRVPGGEPFPPTTTVRVAAPPAAAEPAPPAEESPAEPASAPAAPTTPERPPQPERPVEDAEPEEATKRGRVWGGLAALLALLLVGVLGSRFFLGTDAGADFVARYDGAQPLPADAPVGFPAWLNWAHFFNMFLMALIIKTGIDVRRETRPEAYWTPKKGGKKISLTLWLHQCLDIAWVALGAVFYVLLFATGQWMRIVPTSWDVFPNAVSAGLQYLSLNWPEEHGWVHYNALQELSYFAVVFIAAPLSIASGFRMSGLWPKAWSKVPVGWARAVHFPTMIFFVAFLAVHVILVATTGLRANMNAMFAARDDATGWLGLILFLLAVAVTAAGWWATRPSVVTPAAQATGKVTRR